MFNHKRLQQEDTERARGWIINLLYHARPKPLEMAQLLRLLDRVNIPLTRRRLAREISHLCSLRFVRVFPSDARAEVDEVEQAKLIQRYTDCDSDEEMGSVLCVRLTAAGTNFQEGLDQGTMGIHRVD